MDLAGRWQKGSKNVVKEFLTGGGEAEAGEGEGAGGPRPGGGLSPAASRGSLSIASHTPIMFISVELQE